MTIKSYKDLEVWKKAMDLVVACYKLTEAFPRDEAYGLTSQLRRAAVSVPANIAEGHARAFLKEYLHHLSISYGSLAELETHLEIASRLGYVNTTQTQAVLSQAAEIGRMLNGLMSALRAKL